MTSATPTKPVVHVIDDDDAVRDSLAFLLRSAELGVETYENAVAFLQSHPPQGPACIVTDVRMPEVGGIELLRRLRERNVTTPVIVITGHGDVPLAVEAMKLGAADFLEKPFSDESLLGAVRSALAVGRGQQQAWHRAGSDQREARLAFQSRTSGAGRPRQRSCQQVDRLRSPDQPPNGRNLPRQPDDQDERVEPVGARARWPCWPACSIAPAPHRPNSRRQNSRRLQPILSLR